MFQTKNDILDSTRRSVAGMLQGRLSDGIDLMLQTKQAHWNIRGPQFIALHKLFDRIHEEVENHVDLIAERITQLGEIAEGTIQKVGKATSLSAYPLTIYQESDHIEALSSSLAEFAKSIRTGIVQAIQWNDIVTADILTEVARGTDKNLWFVESHAIHKDSVRGIRTAGGQSRMGHF